MSRSVPIQRNADLPSQDYKCRFTFAFTKMAGKNAELYKYNLVPRSIRPKLGNNPVYEVGWNIQDDGYSC